MSCSHGVVTKLEGKCRLIILTPAIFYFDGQWVKACSSEEATYTVNLIYISVCSVTKIGCHHWEASLVGECFSCTHEFGLQLMKRPTWSWQEEVLQLAWSKIESGKFCSRCFTIKRNSGGNHGELLSQFYRWCLMWPHEEVSSSLCCHFGPPEPNGSAELKT